MRKLIAAINLSLDGFCDHTGMLADEEVHDHFTAMLNGAGAVLYGRITYELMESYWPTVVANPTGEKSMDEFAVSIDNIPKVVFSRTLNNADPKIAGWKNARVATRSIEEEVMELKRQPGKDIYASSPSLILACTKLNLIDEYHLVIHPVVAGKGMRLFKEINDSLILKLLKVKTFGGGHLVVYYAPLKK